MNETGELVNVRAVDYDAIPDDEVVMEPTKDNQTTSANIKNEVFNFANIDTKKDD